MGFFRSQVVGSIKWVLDRQGLVLVSTSRFGSYPFADVKRLAAEWKYPVSTVFDVGASEGESTLEALNAFPKARVLGFEPHPSTFASLMAKVGGNSRFQGFNVALGTEIGEVEMIEYDRFKANSLTPNNPHSTRFNKHGRSIRVQETTLDTFCSEHSIDNIDLIKTDVEGFDLVVLQGSGRMLQKRAVKFVLVEFFDLLPKEGVFGGALMPFEDLLGPFGFQFVASYNGYISAAGEMFSTSNALFCLPPLR
ncbi:FkbM family methyltransferase [Edaphobacter paludis]|uniref:FkbM family methyltransferase n=1 Tax=Edaphobacter paludis TaxID=3035702 RepID=A0AAU7DAF1_9BACT